MKEKTADIDILEEKEKEAIGLLKQEPDFSLSYYKRENAIDIVLKLVENLIAENKELKEKYSRKLIDFQKEREEYERDYISKSKVEAKIEEVSNGTYDAKIVLQSLLGKE